MIDEPVEIKPGDIVKRPLDIAASAGGDKPTGEDGGFLKNMVNGLKQLKTMKQELEELGFDVSGLFKGGEKKVEGGGPPPPPHGGSPGGPRGDARDLPAQVKGPTGIQQAKNILRLLQLSYGDITLEEVIERLKTEYGQKRISDFLKEK